MSQIDPSDDGDRGGCFDIESSEAFIAGARAACRTCCQPIEVFCVYCRSGRIEDTFLETFRVQCLWAIDDALCRQLQRWPTYRWDRREGKFLNHCPHCGATQDEDLLHEEPGQPFYELAREVPEGVSLAALTGRIRLGGDYVADV